MQYLVIVARNWWYVASAGDGRRTTGHSRRASPTNSAPCCSWRLLVVSYEDAALLEVFCVYISLIVETMFPYFAMPQISMPFTLRSWIFKLFYCAFWEFLYICFMVEVCGVLAGIPVALQRVETASGSMMWKLELSLFGEMPLQAEPLRTLLFAIFVFLGLITSGVII